jgi:hypothetical protein
MLEQLELPPPELLLPELPPPELLVPPLESVLSTVHATAKRPSATNPTMRIAFIRSPS